MEVKHPETDPRSDILSRRLAIPTYIYPLLRVKDYIQVRFVADLVKYTYLLNAVTLNG